MTDLSRREDAARDFYPSEPSPREPLRKTDRLILALIGAVSVAYVGFLAKFALAACS